MPSDLQDALKSVNKYTDNTGNESAQASDVTATQDKVFLLAEYEVLGARTYANQYEQNSQAQYDYYKNGNSKLMYDDQQSTSTAISWQVRSACYNSVNYFCIVDNSSGDVSRTGANRTNGFAPAFVVG
jgi:hypothetical protein